MTPNIYVSKHIFVSDTGTGGPGGATGLPNILMIS